MDANHMLVQMGELPNDTAADVVHTAAKLAISIVPGVGGPLAEVFGAVFEKPVAKRRWEYVEGLGERIQQLCERFDALTKEVLSQDEVFVTAALQGAQVAQRTHQEEKRTALLNAIENTVLMDFDEDIKLLLLRYVDELTPTHLRVLDYFQNPINWLERNRIERRGMTASVGGELESVMPEFRKQRGVLELVVADLKARHLLQGGDWLRVSTMSPREPMTTALGNTFLEFIRRDPRLETKNS